MGRWNTFYISPGALRLPGLTCLHPLSRLVKEEGLIAGQWYDAGTGEQLEKVEVQLLGCRPDRVFYMPNETPEQAALFAEFPETANATERICASSNGHESTSGLYILRKCGTCPHVMRRCTERTVVLVHRPGHGTSTYPRELPISWASQGALTQMLVSGTMGGQQPWELVFTLRGDQRENSKKGVSVVLKIDSTRAATPAEIEEAEYVLQQHVEPYLTDLMASTTALQEGRTQALPEGQAGTARGVTISHEPEGEAVPMGAAGDEEPVPHPSPLPGGEGTRAGIPGEEPPVRPRRRALETVGA